MTKRHRQAKATISSQYSWLSKQNSKNWLVLFDCKYTASQQKHMQNQPGDSDKQDIK